MTVAGSMQTQHLPQTEIVCETRRTCFPRRTSVLVGALVAPCCLLLATVVWLPTGTAQTAEIDQVDPAAEPRDWRYIVLHHSASPRGDVAAIDADHRRRKDTAGRPWLGIGYHFVIGNGSGMVDGEVQSTFRWRGQLQGAHAGDRLHNDRGIGICLVGDFNDKGPSARQLAALTNLVDELAQRYQIDKENVLFHSDLVATDCPGRQFPALGSPENPLSPE